MLKSEAKAVVCLLASFFVVLKSNASISSWCCCKNKQALQQLPLPELRDYKSNTKSQSLRIADSNGLVVISEYTAGELEKSLKIIEKQSPWVLERLLQRARGESVAFNHEQAEMLQDFDILDEYGEFVTEEARLFIVGSIQIAKPQNSKKTNYCVRSLNQLITDKVVVSVNE